VAADAEYLAVHFLEVSDGDLADLFGGQTGDEVDKFADCSWSDHRGVPVLADPKAWFLGRVLDRLDLGDHVGHLLEPVESSRAGTLRQLGFQLVRSMTPGHPG
jgi:flavin reductase (DIM6/NTAB) family NADH-FMN oxidoreductase RutF